ncbi:hypothetical protein N7478_002668 [Penicillium angulare]|uniref:uncharacterized protein n=1 Tax=Penicillium angulare TaxID=116970 RepID=UPI0025400C22|nr:uncharacterized protein N7478_002668 [Penicillium angulare]KAJ5286982.1 hypothetical protein N7478_002668 [Penicillium angulare]
MAVMELTLARYYDFFRYVLGVLLFLASYIVAIVLYRLFLSPLAKFPGPPLAASTRLYETYYQILKGGTFTWHIDELHKKYGPVVRITPWEIHIKDPSYYYTVYAGPGKHRNKDSWFSFISVPHSIFSTNSHDLHRPRRKVLGQFFKRQAIVEFEPAIRATLESLCKHFSTAVESQEALELHAAFYSFTSDNLSRYAFGTRDAFKYLEEPKIPDTWKDSLTAMFGFCRLIRHFPIISHVGHMFPRPVSWAVPSFGWLRRLEDDAIFLMMAGTDAPAQVLAITIFHILNNPEVFKRLKTELVNGLPDITTTSTLEELESIHYLSAVIREGLRLSSVVTTRLPRSAPDEVLQYNQWKIPAGTPVSMSTYFILRDPEIFPEPRSFLPERWLLSRDELKALEKYLVPASKGTLGCLGQNLAWAWLHIIIGTLFRRFELTLHDTTERNVEMTQDNFIGQTDSGMNKIQVKVLGEYTR